MAVIQFTILFNAQQARQPGKIYVTGHRVGGVGPTHTAIEYTDANGNSVTLSAGPEDGLLVSNLNRTSDSPAKNFTVDVVSPPQGVNPQQYFQTLRNADTVYCDCVDYDLFPSVADSYNSNSYVNDLIQSTGGSTSTNLGRFVGGNDPLPASNFRN